MTKREELRYPDRLYECTPHCYCGFLIKREVMRKMQKMTEKFETEIRYLLTENIENIELSGWRLAYPDGIQTEVKFAEPAMNGEKANRIKLFRAYQPIYNAEVYMARAHSDDAAAIIKEIEEEAKG